jgi:DNA-nicking Smr family endonuclease
MAGTGSGRDPGSPEFRELLDGVTPLEDRDKLRPAPVALRRRKRREPAVGGVVFEIDRLGERVEGCAPGIDRAWLRRLRNREIPPEMRIDLHSMTSAGARRSVHEALARAAADGIRCVLVIHGRGRRSENEPVLKESLLDWLAEPPVAASVMAFASASGGDGGVGATYVLLRREPLAVSSPE